MELVGKGVQNIVITTTNSELVSRKISYQIYKIKVTLKYTCFRVSYCFCSFKLIRKHHDRFEMTQTFIDCLMGWVHCIWVSDKTTIIM